MASIFVLKKDYPWRVFPLGTSFREVESKKVIAYVRPTETEFHEVSLPIHYFEEFSEFFDVIDADSGKPITKPIDTIKKTPVQKKPVKKVKK